MFEAHAGVGGAELPVNALLGRVAGLRPRGDLRVNLFLRRPARGQGLARQDAQFRFGPVEPAAVPGRKHQQDAPDPALGLGARKGPEKKSGTRGCSDCRRPGSGARPRGWSTRALTGCAQSTAVRRAVAWAVRHGPSGSTNIPIVQVPHRTYA